jgi:adenine-specific DNA-methyltransferase
MQPELADASEAAAIVRRICVAYEESKGAPYDTCARIITGRARKEVRVDLARLAPAWRDHAIACVYATLMSRARRKKLGAYFTPPHLVSHLLETLRRTGIDPVKEHFRDPAAGGAAFIVPLARLKVSAWRAAGVTKKAVVKGLEEHLSGADIEPGLVKLANSLIRSMLVREFEFSSAAVRNLSLVKCSDSLAPSESMSETKAHEVGNPPYRRLPRGRQKRLQAEFQDIQNSRLNLYTMFVRRALDRVAPGKLISYVLPASFLGGPEFAAFRQCVTKLAYVRVIDIVEKRRDLFLDATQDACFLVLQKKSAKIKKGRPTLCGVLRSNGQYDPSGKVTLPKNGGPWKLAQFRAPRLGSTLHDWGYRATIGYLVSNRQPERLFKTAGAGRYPLIWAKAITPDGDFDFARSGNYRDRVWASAPTHARYLVRTACVALQRVSTRGQKRRLNAAAIPTSFVRKHGGIIGENHVIFLVPIHAKAALPQALAQALNAPAASAQFDRMSGSSSISVRLLDTMPLPHPPARTRTTARKR